MTDFDQNSNRFDPNQQPVDVNATPSQDDPDPNAAGAGAPGQGAAGPAAGPDPQSGSGSDNGQQANANPYSNTGYNQPNGKPYSNTGSRPQGSPAGGQQGPSPNYYNQYQYQYQQAYKPKNIDPEKSHNYALISMILGITSVVLCWMGYGAVMGLLTGVAAIVLAILSSKRSPIQKMESMAIAGLITGICGCSLSVLTIACTACAISAYKDFIHSNWGGFNSLNHLLH